MYIHNRYGEFSPCSREKVCKNYNPYVAICYYMDRRACPEFRKKIFYTRPIRFVQQECENSCGVACVAMVAGVSFSEVRSEIDHVPIGQLELETLLTTFDVIFDRPSYDFLYPDTVYIMAAPSLGCSGSMHYIVVDTRNGMKVYDPLMGRNKSYEKIYNPLLNKTEEHERIYTESSIVSWGRLIEILL